MAGTARMRALVGFALIGVVGVLALSACGRLAGARSGAQEPAQLSDQSWDAQALQSIGFTADELAPAALVVAAPTPGPSGRPGRPGAPGLRHRLIRFGFGKKVLHAEAVVQTDEGTKTVDVQRGTITARTGTSLTVKSADGFTLTWTLPENVKVVKDRALAASDTLTVGTAIGLAGAKTGSTPSARLVVVVH